MKNTGNKLYNNDIIGTKLSRKTLRNDFLAINKNQDTTISIFDIDGTFNTDGILQSSKPSVMLSIKPKYCELIARGKKTIDTPFKCYIYCTKEKYIGRFLHTSDKNGCLLFWLNENDCTIFRYPENTSYTAYTCNSKVIGEFVCDKIDEIHIPTELVYEKEVTGFSERTLNILNQSCLSYDEIIKYSGFTFDNYNAQKEYMYGWHISDLVVYDELKELNEFKKYNRECWYADLGLAKRDCPECQNEECFLTHPPQSYCYVEEIK